MTHMFYSVVAFVVFITAACLVHIFGWLAAMMVLLGMVALFCSVLLVTFSAINRERWNDRDIMAVKPEPELDLTRLLQIRKPAAEREQLIEKGHVIHLDLRTKLEPGSHEPHPERKQLP